MNKIWKIFLDTVSDTREPDAKRVGGFLGWMICVIISVFGVFIEIKSPYIVETLFWTSCILLGIDGIANMVRYRRNVNINVSKPFDGEEIEEELDE